MSEPSSAFVKALATNYRIERELGRGGMSVVYLASDLKHDRQVVIKVLTPDVVAAVGYDRFRREIAITARLNHPHIVPLFDSGEADGQLYYVMPHIVGESLQQKLEREPQLSVEEALQLTREIASALGHAHHHSIVHRDIKPGNVLISDGLALVADFGVARPISSLDSQRLTLPGAIVGTPLYMAPEQALNAEEIDRRTDIYSLACVLYQMLAGQPPFVGATLEALLHQHIAVAPRPLNDLRPGLPGAIAKVVARGLAKTPADRYATAALFAQALATAATRDSAPPVAEDSDQTDIPNNLPRPRTRFIGREMDLAECVRLLGGTRLLTLTGIGGCGKTRLALTLARQLLPTFPAGVWFVDLAPLRDAGTVPLALATTLGVQEQPGTPLVDTLAGHFEARHALVVLDNCEHLLGPVAELADALLNASTQLKFIATSRESLGLEGERTFGVRSLSVPSGADGTDPRAIGESDAVRLFLDRVRYVNPKFELLDRTASAVAEICRRLDGIPLAIELAAARVRLLSVEEIRIKLDDRFRLLTGGSRTALARHQTLKATIDWSYDHLSGDEQRLLRHLAVFAGGWTLDAATRITGEDADEFDVLELLTRLTDKSLVEPEPGDAGSTRYSMLETVRQYAQERLTESGEGTTARARHLAFFLALVEEARPSFQGPEQGAWLSRFDQERENLLAAHSACERAEGEAEAGLRLVFAAQLYWIARGLLELGHRVTVEALARPGARVRGLPRARALFAAGQLGYLTGRYDEAHGHLLEGLSIAREIEDRLLVAWLLRALGVVAQGRDDRGAARGYLEESLVLARDLGDQRQLSIALNGLAELERAEQNLDAAEPLCVEFLALARERADRGSIASALLNLAMVSIGRGSLDAARRMLLEALSIAGEIGSRRVGQGVLEATSGLAASVLAWSPAVRLYGAADAQRELMGLHRDPADGAFLMPLIERARDALSRTESAAAEAAGRALTYEEAQSEARAWLAGGDAGD